MSETVDKATAAATDAAGSALGTEGAKSGQEPVNGQQGAGTVAEPFDKGNEDETPASATSTGTGATIIPAIPGASAVINAASKLIYGEPAVTESGQEPVSGEKGAGTKTDAFDQGNQEENTAAPAPATSTSTEPPVPGASTAAHTDPNATTTAAEPPVPTTGTAAPTDPTPAPAVIAAAPATTGSTPAEQPATGPKTNSSPPIVTTTNTVATPADKKPDTAPPSEKKDKVSGLKAKIKKILHLNKKKDSAAGANGTAPAATTTTTTTTAA